MSKGDVDLRLTEAQIGKNYQINSIEVTESITRRLEALGLNEGTKITILNHKRNRGAFIVKVRGTRLAFGRHITDGIIVREVQ